MALECKRVDSVLPQAYFQGQILDYYRANINVTNSRIVEIERLTRGQGTDTEVVVNLWLSKRRKCITSSVTVNIAKRRSTTKVAHLVKTLLYSIFRGNATTQPWLRARTSHMGGISIGQA